MFDRIAVDPKIHFGKPYVAGTRITVQNFLELSVPRMCQSTPSDVQDASCV